MEIFLVLYILRIFLVHKKIRVLNESEIAIIKEK